MLLPDPVPAGEPFQCHCDSWIIAGALRRAGRTIWCCFEETPDDEGGGGGFLALPLTHPAHLAVPFVKSSLGRHRLHGCST